ncbi:MAG: site-specific DNA-methyltransferase, partial [Ignavibacteriales bacterium]|nr:site-specific DNA-methyltransferase [Ignavibacteriales bacterium]
MLLNKTLTINYLTDILATEQLDVIKNKINTFKENIQDQKKNKNGFLNVLESDDKIDVNDEYLENELQQILETKTIDRTKYYIQRLLKSLSLEKTNDINDLNLHRWKEYTDIITDSLWLLDKRDSSGVHNAGYWGNFIPQIPNQMLRRYTKKGDWVLDTFLGSGTTLIECRRLGRNGIGIELQQN